MKTLRTISILLALPLLFAFTQRVWHRAATPPATLSAFGFFEGPIALQQPRAHVVPYGLATPLFSNYAEKARFIALPPGTQAVYQPEAAFELPEGTYLIKTFYMPDDLRKPEGSRRLLETRIMYKAADGWQAWPYIWNTAQTDAEYDPAGETLALQYTNLQGKKIKTDYLVPNKNQCKGCHSYNQSMVPIGIAARHLNHSYAYPQGSMPQLDYWQQQGMLKDLPADASSIPANAAWHSSTASLDERARAYLDINCGYCHRPEGAANTSGLFLHAQASDATSLGIMKTPVAAGRGSGGRSFDIVPGKPDASILLYRMQTNDPGIAMPEIGREQIHAEGVALIKAWIKNMPAP